MCNCDFYFCVVPIPSVTVTAPNSQIVGELLTLECNVTTVRGITSGVYITWSRDVVDLQMTEVNITEEIYTDTYTISQLNTTDEGREYQCEVLINSTSQVMDTAGVILDVMGE